MYAFHCLGGVWNVLMVLLHASRAQSTEWEVPNFQKDGPDDSHTSRLLSQLDARSLLFLLQSYHLCHT